MTCAVTRLKSREVEASSVSDSLTLRRFSEIDLSSSFFDSLKEDYREFSDWFHRKESESAYVLQQGTQIQAFLYLKTEEGPVLDVVPPLETPLERAKIGTLKVDPHGTRLGERCLKKAFDFAILHGAKEVYVTVFPKHETLINLFKEYGFVEHGHKIGGNGKELVLVKSLIASRGDVLLDYPRIDARSAGKYLLAIYPEYHTRLFPDSKLANEDFDAIHDLSHTNSIHKVYVCRMDVSCLCPGDILVLYRTSDRNAPAHYRSVVTSVCVVEERRSRSDFGTVAAMIEYCQRYSVFSAKELAEWYRSPSMQTIKMTYNLAMRKRVTRQKLINEVGLDPGIRWGFVQLSDKQFQKTIQVGDVDESLIIY